MYIIAYIYRHYVIHNVLYTMYYIYSVLYIQYIMYIMYLEDVYVNSQGTIFLKDVKFASYSCSPFNMRLILDQRARFLIAFLWS